MGGAGAGEDGGAGGTSVGGCGACGFPWLSKLVICR